MGWYLSFRGKLDAVPAHFCHNILSEYDNFLSAVLDPARIGSEHCSRNFFPKSLSYGVWNGRPEISCAI